MEQETSFPEPSLQQSSDVQQPFQTLPQQNSFLMGGETDMKIEHLGPKDFSDPNISQLLKTCQFYKALPLLEAELDSKRASLGESNLKLVPLLNQIVDIQIALAQYSKASDLCQKIQQILQNYQEDPNYNSFLAHLYQNMALISRENQDEKEALDFINKSLSLSSPESPQKIEFHRIKALLLTDVRHYKEALQEIQKGLDIIEKSDPIDHISEARAYNTLGCIYWAVHDWEKSGKMFHTAWKICKEYDISSHVEMVKANIGVKYSFFEEDVEFFATFGDILSRRSKEVYDNCFGKETRHPARISNFLTSARYMSWLENGSDVKSCISAAIQEDEALYDVNSEKMREVRLCAAKAARGFSDIIEDLVKPILKTSIEAKTGRELVNLHIQQCHAKVLSGHCYESIFPEAMKAIENSCGIVSLEMLKINELIVEFFRKKNCNILAGPFLGRCLDLYRQIFGENHIESARVFITVSKIYQTGKNFSLAIPCIEQALKIQIEFYGENDPIVSETYWMLAQANVAGGENAKSMKALFKQLRIQEKLGEIEVYQTYDVIGRLYGVMKDVNNSRKYLKKAYQMRRAKYRISGEWGLESKERIKNSDRLKDLLGNNQEKEVF